MANPTIKFRKAQREKCKASILIEGLSGSGKSGLALIIAKVLAGDWDKVFAIDTENESLPLYVGLQSNIGETFGQFNVGELTEEIGFRPSNYIAYRDLAIEEGAEAVVMDSISHAWQYKGGVLDIVNEAKKTNARYQKDSYATWSDDKVMSEKNKLMSLLRHSKVHIIDTVRVKEKMEYDKDENGKTKLNSLGEQQIMQADIKYEPDLVLRMIKPGSPKDNPRVLVIKSRYAMFVKDEEYDIDMKILLQLKRYLEEGADPKDISEEQRQDYITAVKAFLDKKPNFLPIWQKVKNDAGLKEVKLEDIPLEAIKQLYLKIVED